jgi:hypothetical protein
VSQKSLSKWLILIIIGVAICGLVVYAVIIPLIGKDAAARNPDYSYCYYPWLVFLWATAVPCYIVLFFSSKIAVNIGRDRSFSADNAKYLKWNAILAAADTVFFFAFNVIFMLMKLSHPSIFILSLMVTFFGMAISIVFAALSHLVLKASALQDQSDLTI